MMVDASDVSAMAVAIQELIYQPELRDALKKKGVARAAQFRWEKSAAELLRIYRAIGEHK